MNVLLERAPVADGAEHPVLLLGEAAACVAHQFKNSLQALGGLALASGPEPSGPGGGGNRRGYEDALRSLRELTDDVLAVAGADRPGPQETSLPQAVSTAVLLARTGTVRVTVAPVAEALRVETPRGRLVHALYNLIDNACRATPPGGAVAVRMARAGECARVEIEDHGPGLPPGLDGTRGPAPSRNGSGLGLLAARRFLESSGGRLEFEPAPSGGTVSLVTLPLAVDAMEGTRRGAGASGA